MKSSRSQKRGASNASLTLCRYGGADAIAAFFAGEKSLGIRARIGSGSVHTQ